ncbi:MAG: hypothetical protein ABI294_03525 [Casimicrobiaceae bacterium]
MRVRTAMLVTLCAFAAGCETLPPAQETFYFDENAMAPLPSAPVDYPPIEQVQIPPPVEPTPLPAVVAAAAAQPDVASAPDAQGRGAVTTNPPGAPVAQQRIVVAALPPAKPAVPEIPAEDLEVLTLMSDLAHYNALVADDVKRELATLTQVFRSERTDANRVRLAVLYTMTHSPQDDLRAQQLLDNVAKSGGPQSAVKQLAAVLEAQVTERTRSLHDEQVRANDAVQKLEALRQMERSLLRDRVSSGGGGAGGGAGGGGK